MTPDDIAELMTLRGWTQADLARALEVSPGAVCKWLTGDFQASGPARVQMRGWLDEARKHPTPERQTA